jgi:uncharacterized protein YfkK (UPF0435 family)
MKMKKSTLNKMLDLSNINPTKESDVLSSFDLIKESVNGNTYAIIRENKKYYIKETKTTKDLKESDFDYIGGVANKAKNNFKSFSEAAKHLNLMFEEINNHFDVSNVNILESDSLNEKKYVLKLDKKKSKKQEPKIEEPKAEDEFDFGDDVENTEEESFDFESEEGETEGGEESFDFESEEEPSEEESFDFESEEEPSEEESFDFEEGEEFDDTEDEIRDIQSTTGKLGQQLRDIEDISSDMQKWVAKSVLSALDLDTMDSEDKKDIIKTVKTSEDNGDNSEEEEVPSEEMEMEESYDNYMDDEFDGMSQYNWEPTESDSEYDDYDSYMDEDTNIDVSGANRYNGGLTRAYESEDKEEDTELGGDEDDKVAKPEDKNVEDKLLLDIEEDEMGPEEMEALYGPKISVAKKYSRSPYKTAYKQAEKDISKHYHKQSAPGYDLDPVEKWSKHKLPYDTEFMEEGDYMTEDHLNDQMETYEQEKAYEDVETVVKRYGMGVELRKKATSEDPEESVIYLDIINGDGKKVLVSRINSVGDIEVGEMKGNNFSGEPVDSVEDFIEIFGEDLTKKEKQELEIDMVEDIEMSPAPQRTPDKRPSQPDTKPGKPERKSPSERPSRRPFTPPPSITPGEEPGPKAEDEVEFE